jgi:hypothetical protein
MAWWPRPVSSRAWRWDEVRGRIIEMTPTLLERCCLTFPADALP